MSIDYIIEYDCIPKRELKAEGILDRLKERARAQEVIRWFRTAGDQRSPDQMGFEFSQSVPGDEGDKQLIVVQDLLDHSAALDDYAEYCQDCPANRGRGAYGCVGFVKYPISASAEAWLLDRLPLPTEPLIWLLLKQGIQKLGYDGSSILALRQIDGDDEVGERNYFELPVAPQRRLGELRVSGDQVLEMIFGVGQRIIPNHAGILLLFFHAIGRDLEAHEIQDISSSNSTLRDQIDFELPDTTEYDDCIKELALFFQALYMAWKLNVPLFLDA